MISLSHLSMNYGSDILFEDVSLNFHKGKRYGIVGANGTGKSTILRILSGKEFPTSGDVNIPKECKLGFLKQDHFSYETQTLLNVVLQGNMALWKAISEKEELLNSGKEDEATGNRLGELEVIIADENGYEAESFASEILTGLGLDQSLHEGPMSALSGGFKLRVLLAQVLFQKPDLLLLDEPTNHLDIVSIQWLESYLTQEFRGTLVVVSHDRDFLNNVCTHVADVDYETVQIYTGNYQQFLDAKELAQEQKIKEIDNQEKKVAELQAFVDRFKAKATKARQAQSRVKQIEKMEVQTIKRSSRIAPVLRFSQKRPSGKEALTLKHIHKDFGERTVLNNVSLEVGRGEKIAIVGPNGIGKSTLLKITMDLLEPTSGNFEWGYETSIGYFAQDHNEEFQQKISLYEWLYQFHPEESIGTIRGILGQVLFSGDDVDKPVKALSGGEKSRLLFARLMLRHDNVLILDEPTNHLDLEGMGALEEALRSFDGTLLFVSHDRRFVANVADRIVAITPEGIDSFSGSYSDYLASGQDYLNREQQQERDAVPSKSTAKAEKPALSNQERREQQKKVQKLTKQLSKLEDQIQKDEAQIQTIEAEFAKPNFFQKTPAEKVQSLQQQQKTLQQQIAKATQDWEDLAESLEAISGNV